MSVVADNNCRVVKPNLESDVHLSAICANEKSRVAEEISL